METYLKAFKQYANFNGRASRTEFWMFVLGQLAIIIFGTLAALWIATLLEGSENALLMYIVWLAAFTLYPLATFIPSLAITVRRLHDSNKSGLWVLIGIVPYVGLLWLIVLMCMAGTEGDNEYGPPPPPSE